MLLLRNRQLKSGMTMKKIADSATPIMDMYLAKSDEMLQMPLLRRTFGFCVHLDHPC